MNRKVKVYVLAIILPLLVGGLSALLTANTRAVYEGFNKPVFAPPGIVFPIVWGILYLLMGISSGAVYLTPSQHRYTAIKIYLFQLALNFFWPLIFFNLDALWVAFAWILALDAAVIAMVVKFYVVNKKAGLLQIPYAVWCVFATVLNLSIALMN